MAKSIKKFYSRQLFIAFILCIISINCVGLLSDIDDYSKGSLFMLSLVAGLLFMLLNALINSLNFTYKRHQNKVLAFYIPIAIWVVFLCMAIYSTLMDSDPEHANWLLLLLWGQPIYYNFKVQKAKEPQDELVK